jgi:2-succinyl-6-hydroxy-2,4-cyclohexadiene-1-carboxylate synthase
VTVSLDSVQTAEQLPERLAVNGVEIAWGQWGSDDGPPFVLCHGYTGSAMDFSLQIPALSVQRRVVALDLRGHGRSTAVGDVEGYTLEQMATDLAALLEKVGGGEPVDLLGHSMGGVISMLAVLERPELVRSLILMDTSGWSFLLEDDNLRKMVQGFITKFDPTRGMPPRPKWKTPEDALIEAATEADWRERRDAVYFGMDAYAYKALGMTLAFEGSVDLRDRLGDITCPVTVLAGELDRPLVDQADELAAVVADGRVTIIPGAYHSPQLSHADEWRTAVEAHLLRADG